LYSFPAEGEGSTWRQGQARRIFAPDLAMAWRAAAGGCDECGEEIEDPCVGACIAKQLTLDQLTSTWNQVAGDMDNYPNYGVPGSGALFFARDTSFCFDLAGGDSSWQTPIQLWRCNGLVNQAWVWTEDLQIILAGSNSPGKCIDLPGGDARNGNYVWLWECNGGEPQGWFLDGQQIKYKANPKFCVDLPGGDASNGNRLWLWECNGRDSQNWETSQLQQQRAGRQQRAVARRLELRAKASRPSAASTVPWWSGMLQHTHARVQSGAPLRPAAAPWHESPSVRAFYANASRRAPLNATGRAASAADLGRGATRAFSTSATEQLSDAPPAGRRPPSWGANATHVVALPPASGARNGSAFSGEASSVPRTIALRSGPGLYCLDLPGGMGDDTRVQVWECNGHTDQLWLFDAGSWEIQYAADPSKCLDAGGGSQSGAELFMWYAAHPPRHSPAPRASHAIHPLTVPHPRAQGVQWAAPAEVWLRLRRGRDLPRGYELVHGRLLGHGNGQPAAAVVCRPPAPFRPAQRAPLPPPTHTPSPDAFARRECNQQPQQQFEVNWGTTIRLNADYTLCFDVVWPPQNGAELQLWDCNGHTNQQFVFDPATSQLKYGGDPDLNLCVDAHDVSVTGTRLFLWDCNGMSAQAWGYDASMQTIYLSTSRRQLSASDAASADQPNANLCVDLTGGDVTPGTALATWDCNACWNQQFLLGGGVTQASAWGGSRLRAPRTCPPNPHAPASTCAGGWPSFSSAAELSASPWGDYISEVYGEVPQDATYPWCMGDMWSVYKDRIDAYGATIPASVGTCPNGGAEGQLYEVNNQFQPDNMMWCAALPPACARGCGRWYRWAWWTEGGGGGASVVRAVPTRARCCFREPPRANASSRAPQGLARHSRPVCRQRVDRGHSHERTERRAHGSVVLLRQGLWHLVQRGQDHSLQRPRRCVQVLRCEEQRGHGRQGGCKGVRERKAQP
jgi:hypothetical protein